MRLFIVQHISSLLTVVGGIYGCFMAFGTKPKTNSTQRRAQKFLRILGPLMVILGLVGFLEQPTPANWQRHMTKDRVASAEFPSTPEAKEIVAEAHGLSVPRSSLSCNDSFRNIVIMMARDELPPSRVGATDADRVASIKEKFIQQGDAIIAEQPMQMGDVPGFALAFEKDAGKSRVWLRVAFIGDIMYRLGVVSTGSYHDDPIIERCLGSFSISPPSPDTVR